MYCALWTGTVVALWCSSLAVVAQQTQPEGQEVKPAEESVEVTAEPAAPEKKEAVDKGKQESDQMEKSSEEDKKISSDVYELKLRSLEERVNELKEKIFRTKARILQLQETVVTGSIGVGARAILTHRNEMGGAYRLVSVQYALDAQPVFKKVDVDGDLDGVEEKEIFNGIAVIFSNKHYFCIAINIIW